MYQVGQQVLYGSHGICNIVSVERMRFGKTRANYYALQPVAQAEARFYVPVDNEAAVAKLRPIASRDELLALLHSESVRTSAWIPEENQRKLRYRELIGSGDRAALLQMIYTLHLHRARQQAEGKKFHQCDDNFLTDAQKLLSSELAVVFDLGAGEVNAFIRRELGIE